MQGTCLKTEWCTQNYIFMLIFFTFDPGEVTWISFGPKNVACSQNSLDSGRLLHPCSVVSVPCVLDQAVVVHDPLHGPVSCFTIAFNDGRRCVCLRFWQRFIGYTVREVDRYGGRSGFVGERGEEWGKQVGSVNEESQVRGCCNNFYWHQPGNSVCVGKDKSKQNI